VGNNLLLEEGRRSVGMKYAFFGFSMAWFIILQLQRPHVAAIQDIEVITGEQLYLVASYLSVRIAAYTFLAGAFIMEYIDKGKKNV